MKQNYQQSYFLKFILFFLFLSNVNTFAQTVWYVKEGGTGNGSSWANASGDLQLMINNSSSGDQIWVASGTYKPIRPADDMSTINPGNRKNAFRLKSNIKIYGGFAGNETVLSARILSGQAPSILSADFMGDDTTDAQGYFVSNYSENAYHVVIGVLVSQTVFDGFHVVGGYANSNTNMTVNTRVIDNNSGAGMSFVDSSVQVSNITVKRHYASLGTGGADFFRTNFTMYNCSIVSCKSNNNTGGLLSHGNAEIVNSVFINCHTPSSAYASAIHLTARNSGDKHTLTNVSVTQCSSGSYVVFGTSNTHIRNSIFYGNGNSGNYVYGLIKVADSIVEGSGGSSAWGGSAYGNNMGGNLDVNPQFVNSATGDLRLQSTSPAINAGNNLYYQLGLTPDLTSVTKDLGGNARVEGSAVDMGAYEYEFGPGIRYVKENGTGDGSSWANASSDLQLIINNSFPGDQIWVARGIYKPIRPAHNLGAISPGNSSNAFVIKTGVNMYGGFVGNETSLQQRTVSATEPSLLTVDFLGDDMPSEDGKTISNQGDNGAHVVIAAGVSEQTLIDGFKISGGRAWSHTANQVNTKNIVSDQGAGIYMIDSDLSINNCIIGPNRSTEEGGGIYCSQSWLKLTNSVLTKCSSYNSTGGLHIEGAAEVINCLFIKCYGGQGPGAIYSYRFGNLYTESFVTNSIFTQCGVSVGNRILTGGQFLRIRNSIIYGNYAKAAHAYMYNCLVEDSNGSTNWDTTYGTNQGGNIDANPLFTNAANGDFTLQAGSPAINAGSNAFVTAIATDFAGNARIYGGAVDMGAYEFGVPSCTIPSAPTAENQTLCTISNPTVADLTAEGTNLKWYTVATGGTVLEADEEVIAGTYYVSQSNGTCESERTAIEVTLANNCIALEDAFCNITATFSKPLYAAYVPGATKYRFRVKDGNNVQVIERTGRYFYVNNIEGFNYDKHYSVSVSYHKDGQWSAYGPACSVSTPALAQSQLKPEYCGIAVSSFAMAIYASSAPMTTGYRFRIVQGGNTQVIEKTVGYFKINEITGYTYGKTYTVDIAIKINGEWGAYGPDCTVTTSEAVAQLADAYCGIATPNLKTVIYAKGLPQATSYRFRINDGNTDHILTRTQRYFLVSQIPGYTYSTAYTVNVAALINGNWTDYGPACTITTPVAPLTHIVAAQCGAMVPSLATNIKIGAVSRAQGYRLRITNGQQEQILDRPSASFRLNMLASRQYNVSYTVEIAVLVNGEYGPYGSACTITAVSATSRPGSNGLSTEAEMDNNAQAITVTPYPNPYTESFAIELNTQSLAEVTVRAFDTNGRLVEDITVSPEELSSRKLGNGYAAGIYNVVVAQGEYRKAFKIVKK